MKQFIKSVIIKIYALFKRDRSSKIIYYHDVYNAEKYADMGTPFELFQKHISTICDHGFEIVSKISKPDNQVMICFDDGFRGIWDCKDFFINNKIYPTIFIAVELIGKPGYLSIEEIKELQKQGFIFQCHAWSHKPLSIFSKEELIREIVDSKATLEDMLNVKIDELCFPLGYFNDDVLNIAYAAGYKTLYSSLSGPYNKRFKPNVLCRYLVQCSTPSNVKYILMGGDDIFYKHDIGHHYCNKN